MKNCIKKFSILIAFMAFFSAPAFSNNSEPPRVETTEQVVASARAEALKLRLYEIREIDKSKLSSTEKRQLRKEVRQIKQELSAISGGIYLSVGALIVILLLILIL